MIFRAACLIALTCLAGCYSLPYNSISGPIGTITAATGLPSVTRNNQPYILAKHSKIYIGDIIATGNRSAIGLALISGQTINIPPQSQWLVINMSTNGVDYKSSSGLAQGALQMKGRGDTPHEFIVRTAIAELQTLSEHFWLGYPKQGNTGLIVIAMDDTPVTVRNRNGTTTLTAPGQTTTVAPGVAPQDTTYWTEQKLRNTIEYYNERPSLTD